MGAFKFRQTGRCRKLGDADFRRRGPRRRSRAGASQSLMAGLFGLRRSCAPAAAEMPEGGNDRPARSRPRSLPAGVVHVQRTAAGAATREPAWNDCDLRLQVLWSRVACLLVLRFQLLRFQVLPRARGAAPCHGPACPGVACLGVACPDGVCGPGERRRVRAARGADRRGRWHPRVFRNCPRRGECLVRSASRSRRSTCGRAK